MDPPIPTPTPAPSPPTSGGPWFWGLLVVFCGWLFECACIIFPGPQIYSCHLFFPRVGVPGNTFRDVKPSLKAVSSAFVFQHLASSPPPRGVFVLGLGGVWLGGGRWFWGCGLVCCWGGWLGKKELFTARELPSTALRTIMLAFEARLPPTQIGPKMMTKPTSFTPPTPKQLGFFLTAAPFFLEK